MKIKTPFQSPNTDDQIISVQFLILHYTACSLETTLNLFKDPQKKVSSHFVIDVDGCVYQILPCLNQKPLKAFHAGESFWIDKKNKKWKEFNNISLGIELVSKNGNIFPYTELQYQSLIDLTLELKTIYPELQSPDQVLGHEHIAGHRGKVDPGHQFQWKKYFKGAYPGLSDTDIIKINRKAPYIRNHYPKRSPALPENLRERFSELVHRLPEKEKNWSTLNSLLEKQHQHHLETDSSS